ncbi:MAG: FAD:protein FMN transferase [Bacteroides sp.]|nr:FAD:protein FMN transferase [Bacteroides sp.]
MKKTFFSSIILLLPTILTSCASSSYEKVEGMIWNTFYHITYQGHPSLADSIQPVLSEVSRSLSVFDKSSLVSRVNESIATPVDRHFSAVYTTSLLLNSVSKGMFDPTLSPLITAWGFGPGHKITNDTTRIDSILAFTGIAKTHIVADTLIKEDIRTQFNFSAVAKGYGCDMVAEMFRRNGVDNYLIEIGGEITAAGISPSGESWKISIDTPEESETKVSHDSYAVLNVTDAGLATSGNYRNFHKVGSESLGHTISPLTGRPVTTDVISATVIAPSCMEADAAATACMAAGSEVAKEMLANLRFEGMLILSDTTTFMTPGFKELLSNP